MDEATKAVHLSVSQSAGTSLRVSKPFALQQDDQRPYVPVEFDEKIEFRVIKEFGVAFHAGGSEAVSRGVALSVSSAGAVIDCPDLAPEGSILTVTLTAQGGVEVKNILAVVKRIDQVDGSILAGIAFLSRETLRDHLSAPELDLLSAEFESLSVQLRKALAPFVSENTAN
ncbi:MAG TPA: hypothetical protein VLB27_10400 [candidate division Zixibacteria bacterium]|nr:hypothetical protein [candidate division Zixibacteria bacterium]